MSVSCCDDAVMMMSVCLKFKIVGNDGSLYNRKYTRTQMGRLYRS